MPSQSNSSKGANKGTQSRKQEDQIRSKVVTVIAKLQLWFEGHQEASKDQAYHVAESYTVRCNDANVLQAKQLCDEYAKDVEQYENDLVKSMKLLDQCRAKNGPRKEVKAHIERNSTLVGQIMGFRMQGLITEKSSIDEMRKIIGDVREFVTSLETEYLQKVKVYRTDMPKQAFCKP